MLAVSRWMLRSRALRGASLIAACLCGGFAAQYESPPPVDDGDRPIHLAIIKSLIDKDDRRLSQLMVDQNEWIKLDPWARKRFMKRWERREAEREAQAAIVETPAR